MIHSKYLILQSRYQSLEQRYEELLVEHTKLKKRLRDALRKLKENFKV
jgi:hypothetical protein